MRYNTAAVISLCLTLELSVKYLMSKVQENNQNMNPPLSQA